MDPETCWNELRDAIANGQYGDASHHAENLREWIARGGFVPEAITHIKWANMVEALLYPHRNA
jgi:hypothetical protein